MVNKIRCKWANSSELMKSYHDLEYGFEVEDDNLIFERLMLEIYQAGLNWSMILNKRKAFNKVFLDYNINKVSAMTDNDLNKLLNNKEIIRNRLKIYATRNNATIINKIIEEYGSFNSYLKTLPFDSDLITCVKIMKKTGFKFIGRLILEEFFFSIGFNKPNHESGCYLKNTP